MCTTAFSLREERVLAIYGARLNFEWGLRQDKKNKKIRCNLKS